MLRISEPGNPQQRTAAVSNTAAAYNNRFVCDAFR